MAQSVFFSFEYEPDNWRVQQVLQMGAVSGGAAFTSQDWETVRQQTDAAIEKWIHEQMLYTRAVIVLVSGTTAASRWVKYEITKAWNESRPLLGVRIHGLRDKEGHTATWGTNPFGEVTLKGGGSVADHVRLINPPGNDSKAIYNSIDENLEDWVSNHAYKRS